MPNNVNRRRTAGYWYTLILTQAAEILESGLLFLVPMSPKEKSNLFLGEKLAIFVYIARYALVGWLLSHSVGLMLFTASFAINYYWPMMQSATSRNTAKRDQNSLSSMVKLVRLLAGILTPMRIKSMMDGIALMACSVAFVMALVSANSLVSCLFIAYCFYELVFQKLVFDSWMREMTQGHKANLKDYLWAVAAIGALFNSFMFYIGGAKLLTSVFRLNSVSRSPLRAFSKAAVAVSFSSVMLNEISKSLDKENSFRAAPWGGAIEAVD